jgi:hypothetical protein
LAGVTNRYAYNPGCPLPPDSLFETPPADTIIWRYFPLERFVSLIERRKLFLSRAGRLKDDYEGATPILSEQKLMAWEEKYVSPEGRASYRENRRRAREIVVVNCWHMSEHEDVPMYDRYMELRRGLAVKSTVGRLGASFAQRQNSNISSNEDIEIWRVHYIDYEADLFPPWNVLYHFVHKRLEYKAENEVRVVALITDAAAATASLGGTDFEVNEAGLLLPVNVEALIDTIYIAPKAPADVKQTVRELLRRAGLESIPVRPSRLTTKPVY